MSVVVRGLLALAAAVAPVFGVSGPHVTRDGAPFFPVLAYYQCGGSAAAAAAAGVDLFVEQPYTACTPAQPNDFSTDPPPPGVLALSDDYSARAPAGAGWYLPDEPDGAAIPAADLPQLPPAAATGKLRVLNVSEHFYSGQAAIRPGYDAGEYARFAAHADLVGFDLYPIVKFCGRVPLLDVFRAQRELATAYAPGLPTFQWIETGAMTGECPSLQVTPAIAQAEAWLAVAGGAAGIGWFTSSWLPGRVWDRWEVDDAMVAQMRRTDARLHLLAPVLAAPWGPVDVQGGPVAASTRTLGGELYVIAVNAGGEDVAVRLRVPGLRRRPLLVLDENRVVRPAGAEVVRDSFGPYAVHLYRAAP